MYICAFYISSQSASTATMVAATNQWDNQITRLLIATRAKYERDFKEGRVKKGSVWDNILNDMRKVNPNIKFTTLELTKKYNNLMITYKRIKRRGFQSGGEVKTSWEYFDSFDSIYGDIFSTDPSQFESNDNISADPLGECVLPNDNDLKYWNLDSDLPSTSTSAQGTQQSRRSTSGKEKSSNIKKERLKGSSIINYLKEYDIKCEKRHRQTLKVEIKKIKVEEEKVAVLKEIRDILKEIRY